MYGHEFADIYDVIHEARGKDYLAEAKFVAERIRARFQQAASLLDVGCATGSHLACFGQIFDHVEGMDISEAMLAEAKKRLPGTRLHHGDMRSFDLGRTFDAITCMFGTIGHQQSTAELTATLTCFARHLSSAGVVAVDPWWFSETFTDGYVAADVITSGGCKIARVSHAERVGDTSRMEVHYIVASSSGVRHFSETYIAMLFTRRQYEQSFYEAGLYCDYLEGVQSGRGLFIGEQRAR